MPALPDPFVINIAQDTLDDLNRRLRDTRWALDLDNDTTTTASAPANSRTSPATGPTGSTGAPPNVG
jgi:hypothetical protein